MKRKPLILALLLGLIIAAVVFMAGRNAPVPVAHASASPPAATPTQVPTQSPSPIPQLIAFADPAGCVPAASFIALLDQVTPMDQAGRPAKPVARAVPGLQMGEPRLVSEGTTHRVNVPVRADWHGLALIGLSRWWAEESDYAGFALHFANSPSQVITALNAQGFALPPSGAREAGVELPTYLAVAPDGAGARFSCSS